MEYVNALKTRRSVYAIGNAALVPDEELQSLIGEIIEASPSAFNSQSQRTVLLLGAKHEELWKITLEALRKIVPEKQFPKTEAKIKSFAAGHGTLLFFDETAITEALIRDYPLYKDNFPVWAQQQAGILQGNVWTALSTLGYGASLQHYNELVESQVKAVFGFPNSWKLLAQMPFGNVLKAPGAKEYEPLGTKFKVLK